MLKIASLFSQIPGEISRIDFLQTGHKTRCLSVIQKAFVPGPSLFRCSFVILQEPIPCVRYSGVFLAATESLYISV